jgi:2-polyprenyl-6-methoxyphenol hydroxylase-like FAD-dependent oxidoreductase
VVGGGVAGFAMARALSLREVPYELVERLPETATRGTGLNLPGNAVRALAALRIADEVIARGVPIRRREYRNAKGKLLFAIDEAAFWDPVASSVGVRHQHLLAALHASVPDECPLGHRRQPRRTLGYGRGDPAGVGNGGDRRLRGVR